MSWINLTDRLYGLFKTDKHANEVRKMDCPKIIFSNNEVVENIWELLGYYKEETATLCETNIQATAEELSKSKKLEMSKTKLYWAIEELVRVHEHAHHLFSNLQWRNYKSNGKLPFIVQSSVALSKLVAQKDIKVSLKLHNEYEKTQIPRSILDQQVLPPPRFEYEVIESLPQFAVYYMIKGDAELGDVFKELDNLSPPDYRHWKYIFKSCRDNSGVDGISVVHYVFNLVISLLCLNGLMKNVTDATKISIKDVLDSLRGLSIGS